MQTLYVSNKEEYDFFLTYTEGKQFIGTEGTYNKYKFPNFYAMVPQRFEKKEEKYNSLIFGKDQREKIVSIEVKDDKAYLYKNDGTVEIETYHPWLLGSQYAQGATKLKGNQYYKYIKKYFLTEFITC